MPNVAAMFPPLSNTLQATDPLRFPAEQARAAIQSTPIFKLKAPRPDLCVGLSDQSLVEALEPLKNRTLAKTFLADLQDNYTLISQPFVTPLGLRFPFLIVEAKSGATGGNLYQAQNQAAVSGAAALRIFQSLAELCLDAVSSSEGGQCTTDQLYLENPLTFSLTTEGAVHELWAHFAKPADDEFCMACIGVWRTTAASGAKELLQNLAAILGWGTGQLKSTIISGLENI